MSTKYPDPWAATEPGFDRYIGPAPDDGFAPMDSQAKDLADYLRAEVQNITRQSPSIATIETVALPNGTTGQLSQKSADEWELLVHLHRDFYRVTSARTRDEVLRMSSQK
jgi:hypothetical protein